MPVTPLHLGPGVLFKSLLGDRMSLCVFACSQVVMDLEVVGRLLAGAGRLHGFSNTLAGATALLVPSVVVGRFLGEVGLRWWNAHLDPDQARWLAPAPRIRWGAAWWGGILGIYSHWALDALMHADARPLGPWYGGNPWAGWLSVDAVNALCGWALAAGVLAAGVRGVVRYLGVAAR